MTKILCNLANGKVIMALEVWNDFLVILLSVFIYRLIEKGGYNLNSISESMSSCVSALLGDPVVNMPPTHAKFK